MSSGCAERIGTFDFPRPVLDYLEARGHDHLALERYAERVPHDLAGMAPWVVDHTAAIWDIGCGLGGLTSLLGQRFPVGRFMLTDGNGAADRKVGYCADTQGWFDVAISRAFVAANGVELALEQRDGWRAGDCSLVFSLKSWGHHYPGIDLSERRSRRAGDRRTAHSRHQNRQRWRKVNRKRGLSPTGRYRRQAEKAQARF